MISTPTLITDKANANLIDTELTKLLWTNEKKIITGPKIKEEHLDKYALHIKNVGTTALAKSLSLCAQAIWHAKDSSITTGSET